MSKGMCFCVVIVMVYAFIGTTAVGQEEIISVALPPLPEFEGDQTLAEFQFYYVDAWRKPGAIHRLTICEQGEDCSFYDETIYVRSRDEIHSLCFHPMVPKIFFVNANQFEIYSITITESGPSEETVVYTHDTYVRDIAFVHDEPGEHPQNPSLEWHVYFSEATGTGANGTIYRVEHGDGASEFYEVKLEEIDGFWAGDFAFSSDGTLFLSSGNTIPASLYQVGEEGLKRIFTDTDAAVMGFVLTSATTALVTNGQGGIYWLDLPTGDQAAIYVDASREYLSDVSLPPPGWMPAALQLESEF